MATYLTNDKLVIVGAAGMIGSNMVQNTMCTPPVWKA